MMTFKTIAMKADDSFNDDERAEADQYLSLVMSSWKDISQSTNKSAGFLLGFMALFELLISQKSLDKLEIGSFSFDNTSILQIAIPVVVAYLVFNLNYLGLRWIDHQAVYNGLTRRFYPRMAQNNLAHLVRPQLSSFVSFGQPVPMRENQRPSDVFPARVSRIFSGLTSLLLPLAFEIQAYVHLFHVHGNSDPLLWISLVISTSLMCCNIVFFSLTGMTLALEGYTPTGKMTTALVSSVTSPKKTRRSRRS
jgi:hypothetical protein